MSAHTPIFSLDQIGCHTVRFSSTGVFETHKDQMVDPYALTRIPKESQVEGFQFMPQTKGLFPSIVLLHDRWGLTNQIRETAQQLAREGYIVLVPNLYGRQGGMVTANNEVAEALMSRLNEQDALQDIHACCEYLNTNIAEDTTLEQTKRNIHGVIGYGMGGTLALQFACKRKRLRCAIAYYGALPNTEKLATHLYCPILYHAPASDGCPSPSDLEEIQRMLKEGGKEFDFRYYPGTAPGFCNETQSDTYHKDAACQAWASSMAFLDKYLKTSS